MLDKCEAASGRDPSLQLLPIILGFAKARVDRPNRPSLLRAALEHIGTADPTEETTQARCSVAWTIVDDDMLRLLIANLDDKEDKVRLGALRVLGPTGMRGRDAVSRVLRIAKGPGEESTRAEAFSVLGLTLSHTRVSELEECLRSEESPLVKLEILQAIRLVNLVEQ